MSDPSGSTAVNTSQTTSSAHFKVNPATANQHLKSALKAGTKNRTLKQTKGAGASGSFKVNSAAKPKKAAGKKKHHHEADQKHQVEVKKQVVLKKHVHQVNQKQQLELNENVQLLLKKQ